MRYVHLYLVGYFILIVGALAALWYGGVLRQISATWVIIGLVIGWLGCCRTQFPFWTCTHHRQGSSD